MTSQQLEKILRELQSCTDRIDSLMRNAGLKVIYAKRPRPIVKPKDDGLEPRLTPCERWRFKRWLFWKHGGAECMYCGRSMALEHLTIDHIQPRSKGGAMRDINNMLLACTGCNWDKGNGWPYTTNK